MTVMVNTRINGRWDLLLPEHRAERAEWATGWETERIASIYEELTRLSGGGDFVKVDDRGATVSEFVVPPKRHPLVVDLGAEEGDMTALWASWGCDVVPVEPNPRVWSNIRTIYEANDLTDRLAGSFVGFAGPEDRDVARGWTDAPRWPEAAYGPVISDHGFCNLDERPDLPVIKIDTLIEALGRRAPDALTIDVEGAELEVLRGARETLLRDRPLVWCSVHPEFMWQHYGQYENDLHSFMGGVGYAPEHLAYDHEHHWLWRPC